MHYPHNLHIMFPSLMWNVNLKNVYDNNEIQTLLKNVSIENNDCWPENIKTTFQKYNIIDNIQNLINLVEQTCNEFYSYCFDNDQKFTVNDSWLNILEENEYQFDHTHVGNNSFYSAVYYYRTFNEGGEIVFRNPHTSTTSNELCYEIYSYKPNNGDLIIFPSYLMHRVNPNKSKNRRISLTFNIGKHES